MSHEFEKVDKNWQSWLRAIREHPVKAVLFVVLIAALVLVYGFLTETGTQFAARESSEADPLESPIVSATATVEVFIRSDKEVNARHMDRGGHLAFGRGSTSLLAAASSQSREQQRGGGRVMFSGKFEMDSSDAAVGEPIRSLRKSEYAR